LLVNQALSHQLSSNSVSSSSHLSSILVASQTL
jgi:hypothetical protein